MLAPQDDCQKYVHLLQSSHFLVLLLGLVLAWADSWAVVLAPEAAHGRQDSNLHLDDSLLLGQVVLIQDSVLEDCLVRPKHDDLHSFVVMLSNYPLASRVELAKVHLHPKQEILAHQCRPRLAVMYRLEEPEELLLMGVEPPKHCCPSLHVELRVLVVWWYPSHLVQVAMDLYSVQKPRGYQIAV